MKVTREQVLAFRARASHLDRKLTSGSFVAATHGGLQDSIPRAGVIGLNARVEGTEPASWDDPTLCQVWFRGGADYIIPRADIATFTLGSRPRNADACAAIDALADRALDALAGRELKVREVHNALELEHPSFIRSTARSGRLLIRWNASMIWLYACDRPDVDDEVARLELARRFLRWFGPQTKDRFAWWAAVEPKDATLTWEALEDEMVPVALDDKPRMILAADTEALAGAEPVRGVRLVHNDDPLLKDDRELIVADEARRRWLFPAHNQSPGYIPCALIVDGEVCGVWQRQQRKVTIHPWRKLSKKTVEAIEAEALSLPIASTSKALVRWAPEG
jgi:hypothetical protein